MKKGKKYSIKNRKINIFFILFSLILSMFVVMPNINATPPVFINFKLQQSTDQINWFDVDGSLDTGFTLVLNESVSFYYLNVKYAATNVLLKQGFYGFNVTSFPTGFFTYWNSRGVNASAINGTWQAHMWNIINGDSPIFYLHVDVNNDLELIDGLTRDFFGDDTALLRINGDYLQGDYSYSGNITSFDDDVSLIDVSIGFLDEIDYSLRPYILDMDLKQSTGSIWNDTYGSLYSFYSIPISSLESYYNLDIDKVNISGVLMEGFYGFYINSYPSGYFAYWNALGVNSGATPGTWQAHMWKIINGDAPRFYIKVGVDQALNLVDGLAKDFYGADDGLFKVNGDIPLGMYNYQGTLTGIDGIDSDLIEFYFYFVDSSSYMILVDDNYDSATPGWGVDHFDTIIAGIGACNNGGVVYVYAGTYEEVFEINKPIILKSKWGYYSTIITDNDAKYSELLNTSGQTIKINSSHVLIEGFSIERYEYLFETAAVGNVDGSGLSYVDVSGCSIESFFDTMNFSDIDHLGICSNSFTLQYDDVAVILTNVSNILMFDDNLPTYNNYALQLIDCKYGYIYGLYIYYKRNTGIYIDNCNYISIISTSIRLAQREGVFITNSTSIAILDCSFRDNLKAINLGVNSTVKISDNTYLNNVLNIYHAVYLGTQKIHYSKLQYAIDLAEIGMDIYIYPGNYTENIVINKTIKLHGLINNEEVIVFGENTSPTLLIEDVDGIVEDILIEKLTIMGGNNSLKTGIYQKVSGLQVLNCIIKEPKIGYAVYIDPHNYSNSILTRPGANIVTSPVQFRNCYIRGGFYYQYWPFEKYDTVISDQLILKYNDMGDVFLNGSVSVLIQENDIQSLGMMYSSDVQILKNTFENQLDFSDGIYLWSIDGTPPVKDIQIIDNSILRYDSIGLLVAGANDVNIRNNNILACTVNGILLTEDYINSLGQSCIGQVYNVIIEDNDFTLSGSALEIYQDIVSLDIVDNTFDRNQEGIRLHASSYNDIYYNTFINNYIGLKIDNGSIENYIYNNYFNNDINVEDASSIQNIWNSTLHPGTNIMGGPYLGGNYWSDYTGEDTDGDSIGDTLIPYTSSGKIMIGGDFLPIKISDVTPPNVHVVFPNGGESLNGTITISWTAVDDFDDDLDIDIEYSSNAGETWHMIAPNHINNGTYDWDTSALQEGTHYLIRITATDNAGLSSNDTSNNVFTIYKIYPRPVINIVKPLMGFFYYFDSQQMRFLSNNCFIISDITIYVEAQSPTDIEKVEFYIDNQLMNTSYLPIQGLYSWNWDEKAMFYHEIKAIAYDTFGQTNESVIGVVIFNFGLIP